MKTLNCVPRRSWPLNRSIVGALIAAAYLSACASTAPTIQHHTTKEFADAKVATYHLMAHSTGKQKLLDPQLTAALHQAMARKGYQHVARDEARALVSVKLLLSQKAEVNEGNGLSARVPLTTPIDDDGMGPTANDRRYDKTMLVFAQDPKTHRILWSGWSQMNVAAPDLSQVATAAVHQIVQQMPRVALSRK